MTISIRWENTPNNTLHFNFEKSWDWNDWYNAENESLQLIEKSSEPVDILMNLGEASAMPQNIVSQVSMLLRQYPPNLNRIYFVGADQVIEKLIRLCCGFRPDLRENLFFVQSTAEIIVQ